MRKNMFFFHCELFELPFSRATIVSRQSDILKHTPMASLFFLPSVRMITGGKPPLQWPAPPSWVFPRRKWSVWGKKFRTGPKASAAISPWQLACVWGCWCWQHLWSSCFFRLSCGPTGCRPAAQPAKASSSPSLSSSSSSWWPFGPCSSDRAVPACPECVCTVPSSPRLHSCSPCLTGSSMGSGSWTPRWVLMRGTIWIW